MYITHFIFLCIIYSHALECVQKMYNKCSDSEKSHWCLSTHWMLALYQHLNQIGLKFCLAYDGSLISALLKIMCFSSESRMNWCNSFAQLHTMFPAHQIRPLDSFDVKDLSFQVHLLGVAIVFLSEHLVDIWCFFSQYKYLTSGVAYKALSRLMFELSFKM